MSLTGLLHARNQRQRRVIDAHANGWDPATCAEIGRRIEAAMEPCTGLVHEAGCLRCFGARYFRWAAKIARQTGGLE